VNSVEPQLIDRDQIILVGFSFFGDPFKFSGGWSEENEIGRLWKRFTTYLDEAGAQIRNIKAGGGFYELHIDHPEMERTGEFEIFVGVEVDRLEDVPVRLSIKLLPPTKYAVFTLVGQQIVADWSAEMQDWLTRSGHQRAYAYGFQYYDERFKGMQHIDESVLDMYVPVRR
jgi:predicted transcriptional regulator YdeE